MFEDEFLFVFMFEIEVDGWDCEVEGEANP
jgi:hypothetical protein